MNVELISNKSIYNNMTEVIDAIQMKLGYDKFIALCLRQKEANLKHRLTEHGKAKTDVYLHIHLYIFIYTHL
jgi:hypothetical protein